MKQNKSQKIYEGDVEITNLNQKEWEKELLYTEKIIGDLSINSNVELQAPKLTSVGGYLSINSNVELPKLTSVGGYLYIYSNVELQAPKLTSVGGDLSIYSNVELPKLTSVGGDLSINRKLSDELLEKLLSFDKKNTKQWYVNELVGEYLLENLSKKEKVIYRIKGVKFNREWFDKIRKDELTPNEVFAIDNLEHRRIAYEFMDKNKMKQLKDFEVLDEQADDKGNQMKIVQFTIQNMKEPLRFYNCICPSTKREYFVQTKENKCWGAKEESFGIKNVEWSNEW